MLADTLGKVNRLNTPSEDIATQLLSSKTFQPDLVIAYPYHLAGSIRYAGAKQGVIVATPVRHPFSLAELASRCNVAVVWQEKKIASIPDDLALLYAEIFGHDLPQDQPRKRLQASYAYLPEEKKFTVQLMEIKNPGCNVN